MTTLLQMLEALPDLWERVVSVMDEALFLVDREQNIVYVNRRAVELTGFGEEEMVGRHCLSGIRCEHCLETCNLFELGKIVDGEIEILTKTGERRNVLKNAVVLEDAQGAVIGGIETLRDISPLKSEMARCRAEFSRAEERERTLEAVLGSIQEGVIALDPEWRVVSLSRRAGEILGVDMVASLGSTCQELFGNALCEDSCPVDAMLAEGGPTPGRRTVIRRRIDGREFPVLESAAPLVDDDGEVQGSLVLLTDLSAEEQVAGGLEGDDSFHGLVGRSAPMRRVFKLIEQLSESEATVLITGESGTGKELVARALHASSPRSEGPFVPVNCAAIPENLLESELFGHVRGAFTGAVRDRPGRVARAEGGTLFLDEVGDLPLMLQAKLLRLLQERTYERVGEDRTRDASVRVVAATNAELEQSVADGVFREDLYYRLRVIPVHLPPLRERRDDIPLLASRLLAERAVRLGRDNARFSAAALARLQSHGWPGNVRELTNAIEYSLALTRGDRIDVADLPPDVVPDASAAGGRARYAAPQPEEEQARIRRALEEHGHHRARTARALGMDRVTLYRKMRKYGIEGP